MHLFTLLFLSCSTQPVRDEIALGEVSWPEMRLIVHASSNQRTGAWQDRRLQEQEAHDRLSAAIQQAAAAIPITPDLTTGALLSEGGIPATRLREGLKRWNVEETRYYNRSGVELIGTLDLHAWLAPVLTEFAKADHPGAPLGDYTGLLVDARGLEFRPSMSPLIVTVDGHIIMQPSASAPETVQATPPVGYVRDPAAPEATRRLGPQPIFLRALSVNGDGRLLLPSFDSPALALHAHFPSLIASGKIAIVVDP